MILWKRFWSAWRAFGKWMGDAVGRIVMFILYFTIVAPFGLGVRLFSDPLKMRAVEPHWQPRTEEPPSLTDAGRTF